MQWLPSAHAAASGSWGRRRGFAVPRWLRPNFILTLIVIVVVTVVDGGGGDVAVDGIVVKETKYIRGVSTFYLAHFLLNLHFYLISLKLMEERRGKRLEA